VSAELVEYLARRLVDEPDAVRTVVRASSARRSGRTLLEIME
jgi:predicted RNA-binding protein YlqC (UPF0109 family)